jgi:hypothetical protein
MGACAALTVITFRIVLRIARPVGAPVKVARIAPVIGSACVGLAAAAVGCCAAAALSTSAIASAKSPDPCVPEAEACIVRISLLPSQAGEMVGAATLHPSKAPDLIQVSVRATRDTPWPRFASLVEQAVDVVPRDMRNRGRIVQQRINVVLA